MGEEEEEEEKGNAEGYSLAMDWYNSIKKERRKYFREMSSLE